MARKQIGAILGTVLLAIVVPLLALALLHGQGGETQAAPPGCTAPDNGTGTVDLPVADCAYTAPDEPMKIIEGLPPGTTIELEPNLDVFDCTSPNPLCSLGLPPGQCEGPGGSLGGTGSCVDGTLALQVTGTGSLAGFNRSLSVPVFSEFHWAPRTPGDPVQTFSADTYRFFGELFGDPDFCEFRVTAGTDYGLPGPGQTTLTELPSGDFAVDSFFDITYQIEFEGCPGSQLEDYSGTTTDTVRIQLQVTEWSELLYPSGHPMEGQSIDLAFAIWGEEGCTAGSDSDGDSWYDEDEWAIGTDCLDDCPDNSTDDALPPDFTMDKTVNILDVLMYKPKLPPAPYDPRYDLNTDDIVNILDVLLFKVELVKPWPCA